METNEVVVDASVIVKWFIIEEYSEEAIRLRNDYVRRAITIIAPSIIEYEVLNALKYSKLYSLEELLIAGEALNKYGFTLYDLNNELKRRTLQLAHSKNITIYDAAYVALAMYRDTILYTADNELVEKFPDTVKHIRDYK